jgi:hypothetical protein
VEHVFEVLQIDATDASNTDHTDSNHRLGSPFLAPLGAIASIVAERRAAVKPYAEFFQPQIAISFSKCKQSIAFERM